MKASLVLLVALPLPLSAADLVFTGGLERVGHGSITTHMADGRVVDAILPAGIAVPYRVADQVEITCTRSRTVYDAQAQLHNHLRLKNLRLMRTATPEERAEMVGWLSWQPGENLLMPPRPPAPSGVLTSLERVRAVTKPNTILAWYRRLVTQKFDGSKHRKFPGRPTVAPDVEALVVRMARETSGWGYDRIVGALANFGHQLSDQTVGNILRRHDIAPAPTRSQTTSWKDFIAAHTDVLVRWRNVAFGTQL